MTRPPGRLSAIFPRLGDAVVNGLEILALGGLATDEQPAPFVIAGEGPNHRLRHYFSESDSTGLPIAVLVPPLMMAADVYDVSERTSAVAILHQFGVDPWVVDFGAPEREEGGRRRTLSDHVVAVDRAVEQIHQATGRPVHLCGYSQGGMFCYQVTAYRRGAGIVSLVTFGSPVDTAGMEPLGLPAEVVSRVAGIAVGALGSRGLPAWVTRTGFRLLDPVKSVRQRIEFLSQLHDREALAARERQRQFLARAGWVGYAGPALSDALEQFVVHNRMLSGGFVIADQVVTLADITCPVFAVVGEVDEIAPARAVRAIGRAAPNAEVYEMSVPSGHFGLVVGSHAATRTWPVVAEWLHWQHGDGPRPESVAPLGDEVAPRRPASVLSGVAYGLTLAAEVGVDSARAAASSALRAVRAAQVVSAEAVTQLPRLARLEQMRAGTRVSFGALLDEQSSRDPGAPCFLFGDRTYSRSDTKQRIDNVVRGLISIGVRQGEPVGVLMTTRPSAFVVIAALNRLGAVAVLLRPGGPPGSMVRELALGGAARVITDPEHADSALHDGNALVVVLGAAGRKQHLPAGAVDLERVDPNAVTLPLWYRPNPGLARDLAFVMFSGEGEGTRARHISNHRWALSAFGTASSAAITPADTVYATTPLHHPSGLLTAVGGSVAGGARLALSREFSPPVFWEEVRRYGATVVSYTWTLLREVVDAENDPREQHHSIRLFIGSGMPRGVWTRVNRRLGPAQVVEFYAPIDGDAVLANVAADKPGAMGRPLPGGAGVRIAAYDIAGKRLRVGNDGLVGVAALGEVGMLLVGVRSADTGVAAPLRGVFASGDAWRPSGDLFWRDGDGDHWLAGSADSVVATDAGALFPALVDDALGAVAGVDVAVTYPLPPSGGRPALVVSAISLVAGESVSPDELNLALRSLERSTAPDVVRVVDRVPVTTWYRPHPGLLVGEGVGSVGPAWYRRRDGTYAPMTAAVRRRLSGAQR